MSMEQLRAEQPISLAEAATLVPGGAHMATVSRWATVGFSGIKLETYTVGRRRFTSREAVTRFIDRCNALAEAAA